MKASEAKARIASLIDFPMHKIIMIKEPERKAFIKLNPGKETMELHYHTVPDMIHEFLHACFTPRNTKNTSRLFNALEDIRIDVQGRKYDEKLTDQVTEMMKTILPAVDKSTTEPVERAIKALSMTANSDIEPLLKGIPEEMAEVVRKAREIIKEDPNYRGMNEAYELCKPLLLKDEEEKRHGSESKTAEQTMADKDTIRRLSHEETGIKTKQEMKEDIERATRREEMKMPEPREQHLITKNIKKWVRNKAIVKRQTTIQGKLQNKKLGKFPSKYLFSKKDTPGKETVIYVLADLSGSMRGSKLETTMEFINTIRSMKVEGLSFEIRAFNTYYFKNDEIGNDWSEMNRMNMGTINGIEAGRYNDDAHFLRVIANEMHNDKRTDKALLILSDGRPETSGLYKETDLAKVAKEIEREGIKYASVGIRTDSVKKYYKRYVVVDDTEELGIACGKQILKLLRT